VIVYKSGRWFCKGTPAFVEEIVRELIQDKAVGSRSTRITGILRDFE
jgi:(2Fe-2S) ferredoxin